MSSVPKSKRKCSDNHNAMDLAQDIRATLNKYILQDFGVYNKKLLDYKDGYGFKFDISRNRLTIHIQDLITDLEKAYSKQLLKENYWERYNAQKNALSDCFILAQDLQDIIDTFYNANIDFDKKNKHHLNLNKYTKVGESINKEIDFIKNWQSSELIYRPKRMAL